jgi:hypothetical protein
MSGCKIPDALNLGTVNMVVCVCVCVCVCVQLHVPTALPSVRLNVEKRKKFSAPVGN